MFVQTSPTLLPHVFAIDLSTDFDGRVALKSIVLDGIEVKATGRLDLGGAAHDGLFPKTVGPYPAA
jgi:hypothetical protein